MKNKILVPTDFSEVSTDAIHYGAQLANKMDAEFAIVHIITNDNEITNTQKKLSDYANQIKTSYGIDTQLIYKKGNIFTTINEVSIEIGAKLLIMGTHGKVGVKQQLTGSFAFKVVAGSDIPVIVVQNGIQFNEGIKKIVFTVSSTANVRQKVNWAVQIAKIFKAKVFIFNFHESLKETKLKMNVVLNQITDEFDKYSIDYEVYDAEKGLNFGKQVLLFLKTVQADLILIMSKADQLNFVLTPYEEQIMFNKSSIPVMLINSKELETFHWY